MLWVLPDPRKKFANERYPSLQYHNLLWIIVCTNIRCLLLYHNHSLISIMCTSHHSFFAQLLGRCQRVLFDGRKISSDLGRNSSNVSYRCKHRHLVVRCETANFNYRVIIWRIIAGSLGSESKDSSLQQSSEPCFCTSLVHLNTTPLSVSMNQTLFLLLGCLPKIL